MMIGYARVSTREQDTQLQLSALRAAGVTVIHQEKRSGGDATRPVLAQVLRELRPGDTLVVYKLDRLARSVAHFLRIVDQVRVAGADFRSLTEAIDTQTAAGRMMMQIVAAFAEFELEMIRERSAAGQAAARERGARIGRPTAIPIDDEPAAVLMVLAGESKSAVARHWQTHISSVKRLLKRWGLDHRKGALSGAGC